MRLWTLCVLWICALAAGSSLAVAESDELARLATSAMADSGESTIGLEIKCWDNQFVMGCCIESSDTKCCAVTQKDQGWATVTWCEAKAAALVESSLLEGRVPLDDELVSRAAEAWLAEMGSEPDLAALKIWCRTDFGTTVCCVEGDYDRCCLSEDKYGTRHAFCQKKRDDGTWPST